MFGRGIGKRKYMRDREISPDEIFLDSSNLPNFNQGTLEGRLEKPIARGSYIGIGIVVVLVFTGLFAQAAHLQIGLGAKYAARSQLNLLRPAVLFAERGAILDRNGTPLVTNEINADGLVRRIYQTPGFSNVLGYVSYPKKDSSGEYYDTDITGLAGVEKSYNAQLAGKNGTLLVEKDARGHTLSKGSSIPAQNGTNLTLSIDARAQTAFYNAIQQLSDRIPFQGGSGILMDVNTGEIRALVSYPQYDSNVLSSGGPSDVIAGYSTDKRQVYLNRPVQGLYTPGSVVKPIEASGALSDGTIVPEKTINDTGSISVPNPYDPKHPNIFIDWRAIGIEDLRKAIAFSSDVYFYMVGGGYGDQKGLGIDRLDFWYKTFGFTSPTGIDLPGEKSGFLPTPAWKLKTTKVSWNIGDTYHTAIGQYAVQVTPLEEARAIAAIANGGKLIRPTLVKDALPQGESLVVSPQALQVVREGMRQGVQEGTSIGLNDLSFTQIAGKTGTAQLGFHNEFYNAWAVGFFPYDHPKYVYVVVMEHGPSGNALGGIFAIHQFLQSLHAAAPEYFQ
jgi:penicillin-binding protein 2